MSEKIQNSISKLGIRFFIWVVPAVLLGVSAIFLYTNYHNQLRIIDDTKNTLEKLMEFTSSTLVSPLWNYNMNEIELIVDLLQHEETFEGLTLVDMKGKMLVSLGINDQIPGGDLFTVTRLITNKNLAEPKKLGTISAHFRMKTFSEYIVKILSFNLSAFLFGFSILILTMFFAIKSLISKPLSRIAESVKNVESNLEDKFINWQSNDELGGFAFAYNDILIQKYVLDKRLRESEERYKDVINDTNDLFTIVDKAGTYIFVNHAAAKMYGTPSEECIGRIAFDFLHPDDQDSTLQDFGKWIDDGETHINYKNRVININGDVFDISWDVKIYYDDAGEVVTLNAVGVNITDQKSHYKNTATS